jgi:hypothetical protein
MKTKTIKQDVTQDMENLKKKIEQKHKTEWRATLAD